MSATRFLVLFLLVSVSAAAQPDSADTGKPLPAYGLKVGLNFSQARGNLALPEEAYTVQGGGVYGFLADFPLSRQIGVEVNLFYCNKGYQADLHGLHPDSSKFSYTGRGFFSYLEVPVLLQYHFPSRSRRFTLVAGPQFSYLLHRTEEISRRDGQKLLQHKTEGREGVNSLVFGYSYGAHINFRLFRLGLRFMQVASSAGQKNRPYFGGPLRHRVTQLELAFLVGHIKPKYTGAPH